jgi:2-methylisocitrate lyase-like PEP mutase family enzyme
MCLTKLKETTTHILQTGAGTSMSRLGWADLGIATLDTMRSNAEMIASLDPSTPVIADADTGYGGPIMASRTVTQYARAGVAAMHIEDQAQQKRCGHLLGKVIVDREEYYSRLRAAVQARDQLQSDIMIIARTDAKQTYGFDEAMERLTEAVRIGVDVVFFEALGSKEEAKKVCEAFKKTNTPVLLNMVPGGVTPNMTAKEAKEVGFRLMIVPGLCIGPVIRSVTAELEHLKQEGSVSQLNGNEGVVRGFKVCGLDECIELDQKAGGKAYNTVAQTKN